MLEQDNEFKLWPEHFLDDHRNDRALPLARWPSSTFRVFETYLNIHKRLGQTHILDRVTNWEYSNPTENECLCNG